MQIVRGELTDVGPGTWSSGSQIISILRMGERTFRKVVATDDVHHFLNPGDVDELYLHRVEFPFIGRPALLGLRNKNGHKETMGWMDILKICFALFVLALIAGPLLGLIVGLVFFKLAVGIWVTLAFAAWLILASVCLLFAFIRIKAM